MHVPQRMHKGLPLQWYITIARWVPVKGESVQEVLDAAPGEHAEHEQSCDVQQLRQTT